MNAYNSRYIISINIYVFCINYILKSRVRKVNQLILTKLIAKFQNSNNREELIKVDNWKGYYVLNKKGLLLGYNLEIVRNNN